MAKGLELAATAAGRTAPNPMVGCLVVREGQLVGAGFHPKAGQPHAEIFALHQAGAQAQGATLYVTLEPCNHQGRTPPCTQAIVNSGITRVVVGMVDPNPLVQGQGICYLQAQGIDTTVGVLESQCQQLNEAFSHFIQTGRPFGIWKYAMTLDGKIAAHTGDSRWVTGEAARHAVHQLRNQVDAVLIGGATLRHDNPQLTCRIPDGRNPQRVVMSRTLDLPQHVHLWDTTIAPTQVFTAPEHNHAMASYLREQGVTVHVLPELTPRAVLTLLGTQGLLSVLWECGGTLAAAALEDWAIQKVQAFIAPKFIGGTQAPTPLAGKGFARMEQALLLHHVNLKCLGDDLLVTGYLRNNI